MPVKPGPVGILPVSIPNLSLNEPLLQILQAALFVALLLAIAVVDIRTRTAPDGLCLAVALTALLRFSPIQLFGILAALPLLLAAMCGERQGIGGGDIKLAAAAGLVLGLYGGAIGLLLGLIAVVLFFAVRNLIRVCLLKKPPLAIAKTPLPMTPFLALSYIVVYFINLGGNVL